MKKLFAVILAALTFFAVFTFTACSPSADKTADEVLENLKDFKYESVLTEGTYSEAVTTSSETVLTKTGERLSHSEDSENTKSEVLERYNVSDGGYDREGKGSSDSGTGYSYEFIRGGHAFTYSGKEGVENFGGVTLEEMSAVPDLDGPEFVNTVNGVIISVAKAVKAVSVKGGKLKVDLNAMLYGIVSDLNEIFDRSDGKITLGKVLADEKIKDYFTAETYEKITEALSSEEAYRQVAEEIYILMGGLITLPAADTLGEIDLTDFAKDFKTLTENVTKEKFIITKSEKDIKTDAISTVITEDSVSFTVSGEMVFTVKDGAISEQFTSVALSVEMSDSEDYALNYTPDRNYVKTNKKTMSYDISETDKYSGEKCALTDISEALVECENYVLTTQSDQLYISSNQAPNELYSTLVYADFDFNLKVYVDKNDNVTDVSAKAYSFGAQFTSSYNKSEKSLTLSGGEFGTPLKIYLNFDKHSDGTGSGQLLGVEIYSTAADRDARRLCAMSGEYFTGAPVTEGNKSYYPVSLYRYERYETKLLFAKAEISNEKVTGLKLGNFNKDFQSTFSANENKITVTVDTASGNVTLTYYLGFAADDGKDITAGLYLNKADALAGSDCYEFYFILSRTDVKKKVKIEEYLNNMS